MDGRSWARGAGFCRRHGQATLGSMVIKVKGGADDTNRHTQMWGLLGHKINHSIEVSAEVLQGEAMETRKLVFRGEKGAPDNVLDGQH